MKRHSLKLVNRLFILFLLSPLTINAQEKLIPDFCSLQFAGYTGFLSVSAGDNFFNERLSLGLQYGFSPKQITGEQIRTISFKGTYYFKRSFPLGFSKVTPTFNASIMFETGQNSDIFPNRKYPEGYYMTNSLNFPLSVGLSFKRHMANNFFADIEHGFEIGTLGQYLYYYAVSLGKTNENIISLAFYIKINR